MKWLKTLRLWRHNLISWLLLPLLLPCQNEMGDCGEATEHSSLRILTDNRFDKAGGAGQGQALHMPGHISIKGLGKGWSQNVKSSICSCTWE